WLDPRRRNDGARAFDLWLGRLERASCGDATVWLPALRDVGTVWTSGFLDRTAWWSAAHAARLQRVLAACGGCRWTHGTNVERIVQLLTALHAPRALLDRIARRYACRPGASSAVRE